MLNTSDYDLSNGTSVESRREQMDPSRLFHSLVVARAARFARKGRLSKAEELLSPLVKSGQPSIEVINLLAKIHAQQGMLEDARALWKRVLTIDPLNTESTKALERCKKLGQRNPHRLRLSIVAPLVFVLLLSCAVLVTNTPYLPAIKGLPVLSRNKTDIPHTNVAAAAMPIPTRGTNAAVSSSLAHTAIPGDPGTAPTDIRGLIGRVKRALTRYLKPTQMYQVQPGDSLWSIAKRMYGRPELWIVIAEANQLSPVESLTAGQELCIPRLEKQVY